MKKNKLLLKIVLTLFLFILLSFVYLFQLPNSLNSNSSLNYQHYDENTSFLFKGNTYKGYLKDTKRRVTRAKTNPVYTKKTQKMIIDFNSPFELKPDTKYFHNKKWDKSIILVHGLWDSPFYFKDVAPYFQKKGFLVRTILMPGHGTNPVDSIDVSYREWIKSAKAIYKLTQKDSKDIYFGGFSTGALVSQKLVLDQFDIKGLFLFSPGAKAVNPLISISGIAKSFFNFIEIKEPLYHRYASLPSNSTYQYLLLYKNVLQKLKKQKKINIPIFVAMSLEDTTINQHSALKLLKYYNAQKQAVVFRNQKKSKLIDGYITYINSHTNGIMGINHTAVTISPSNKYMGKNTRYLEIRPFQPSYLDFLFNDNKKRNQLHEIFLGNYRLGSRTDENIKKSKKLLLDISYNPHFKEMIQEMNQFIDLL